MKHETTILIVDDDQRFRFLIIEFFEEEGYKVVEAEDGQQALAIVEKSVPDLILLDIRMPQMDGFEVCTRLRQTPQAEKIPIIMLTAMEDYHSIHKAYEAGVTDYISKPLTWPWPILSHRVRGILEAHQAVNDSRLHKNYMAQIETATDIGYWQWNCQTGKFESNEKWTGIVNIPSDSYINFEEGLLKRIHLNEIALFKELLRKLINTGESFAMHLRVMLGEPMSRESIIWVETTCAILEWDEPLQKAKQLCGTFKQIIRAEESEGPLDQERKINRELIQQRDLYQAFFKTMQEAVVIVDNAKQILLINNAAENLFQTSSNKIVGQNIDRYIPDIKKQINEKNNNEMQSCEASGMTAEGVSVPLLCQITPLQWNDVNATALMMKAVSKADGNNIAKLH